MPRPFPHRVAVCLVVAMCMIAATLARPQQESVYQAVPDALLPQCQHAISRHPTHPSGDPSWVVQASPSLDHPFVFFHQRKAGGSSWRTVIYNAVKQLHEKNTSQAMPKVAAFIPCKSPKECTLWRLPNPIKKSARKSFIFGGHFSWSDVRRQFIAASFQKGLQTDLHAMSNFRDPVSRVISCIRYRFPWYSIERHSPEELRHFLLHQLSKYGFGCNNEALRILSGYGDEEEINSLGLPENHDLARQLVQQTKQHIMSSVVVTALEHPAESIAVAHHFLPWIVPSADFTLPHEKNNGNRAPEVTLTAGQRDVVIQLNCPEIEVYNFAKSLLLQEYERLVNR